MTRPWVIHPYDPAADREFVVSLWAEALNPVWPLLPKAIDELSAGLVAYDSDGTLIGFVALDPAGSIPLLLVSPSHQRRGVGTALVDAALERIAPTAADGVAAGSGGTTYIWPGVPRDLPAAIRFFEARGWRSRHDTLDMVRDLRGYRAAPDLYERAQSAGVVLDVAVGGDRDAALAFESATFPSWVRWFWAEDREILVARDRTGTIIGTLLFDGPNETNILSPMLGPLNGTIGCVGVAPKAEGRGVGTAMVTYASELLRDRSTRKCHIGWLTRESFYARAGYLPWRRYRMFRTAPRGGARSGIGANV